MDFLNFKKTIVQATDVKFVEDLIDANPSHMLLREGETVLFALATAGSSLPVARLVMSRMTQEQIDQKNGNDYTALHMATRNSFISRDLIRLLLGEDETSPKKMSLDAVRTINVSGSSALHMQLGRPYCDPEVTELLISKMTQKELDWVDHSGYSVLDLAITCCPEVLEMLCKKTSSDTILDTFCRIAKEEPALLEETCMSKESVCFTIADCTRSLSTVLVDETILLIYEYLINTKYMPAKEILFVRNRGLQATC